MSLSTPPPVSLEEDFDHFADGRRYRHGEVIPINAADLVWKACVGRCAACGTSWYCIVEQGADERRLACPVCDRPTGVVVAFVDPEAETWRFVPALVLS